MEYVVVSIMGAAVALFWIFKKPESLIHLFQVKPILALLPALALFGMAVGPNMAQGYVRVGVFAGLLTAVVYHLAKDYLHHRNVKVVATQTIVSNR